jgi:RNA polymerase sigma factor (sigma-70 family)
LEGWIVRITINTAINCLTANQRNQLNNTVELDQVSNLTFKNETPLDELNRDDLLKLIQALPTGYRLVFNLYVIEGYDHQEIAKQLNITESSSRSQLTRSKIWLKERLNTSSEKKIFRYEKFG